MSANTHVAASALRATDRLRSVGNLEVASIAAIPGGHTAVRFTDSDAGLVVPSDTVVKVWRPFTPGDLVSWVTYVDTEVYDQESGEYVVEGTEVVVHKGRVNNVTTPEGETHAVINVLTGYEGGSEPTYQDFTSRDLRHAVYTEEETTD